MRSILVLLHQWHLDAILEYTPITMDVEMHLRQHLHSTQKVPADAQNVNSVLALTVVEKRLLFGLNGNALVDFGTNCALYSNGI